MLTDLHGEQLLDVFNYRLFDWISKELLRASQDDDVSPCAYVAGANSINNKRPKPHDSNDEDAGPRGEFSPLTYQHWNQRSNTGNEPHIQGEPLSFEGREWLLALKPGKSWVLKLMPGGPRSLRHLESLGSRYDHVNAGLRGKDADRNAYLRLKPHLTDAL